MRRAALLALCSLALGCSGEVSDVNDPANPDFYDPPTDAGSDDAAPFGPENDGEDAAPPDDASDDAVEVIDASDGAAVDVAAIDAGRDVAAIDATRDAATARDTGTDTASRVTDTGPPRCTGSASGQSSIWTCTDDLRSRQRCVSGAVQTERCQYGCVRYPSGTNDVCGPMPATLPSCAHQALLAWGLHPDASDHLRCAGVPASRITQTIGNAAASAGTHARDGYVGGQPYSAATDLSVRGLSATDIRGLLSRLANQGFAAWYRWPGHDGWPSSESPHIHAIYVGARMKSSLQAQVRDWLIGRNGLVSHTTYTFYTWTAAQRTTIRAVFERYN